MDCLQPAAVGCDPLPCLGQFTLSEKVNEV